MIFISAFLTISSTYFLGSLFGSFAYVFPIMLALVILNIEILSLFKGICPFGIILVNVLTLVLTLVFWVKRGKPLLKPDFKKLSAGFRRVLNCFRLDYGLIVLCLGMVFLMITAFILSAFLPINEPDALTYHTYRALIWAQKGFIHHFDAFDSRNLVMPINSEIVYTWIFSLTGKDFGFGLVQYITSFFTISGLWMILSRLKFSYRKRLWTIFIFFSFANVISQISSTQTDLIVGTLLLYSLIFFYDYINKDSKDNGRIKGVFSSLCFAIALGVKSTGFIAGLPLLIFFFVYAYIKKEIKRFLWFFVYLGINFIVFSSYNYILNFIDYSNPFGAQISINRHGFSGGIKGFIANFVNYNIQLLDTAGFKWGFYLSNFIFEIRDALFALAGIPKNTGVLVEMEIINSFLNEQTIGYGIVGLLVFLPCVLIATFLFFKNLVKKNAKERMAILYTLGILFYVNLIFLSFSIGYMVYSIRFVCTFMIISAPCLVLLYFKKNNFYKTVVILFTIFYFFFVSVYLSFRPLKNLIASSKAEPSMELFAQNVRCMKYDYFNKEKKSCEIDENILSYIEEYKTVGIFPDKYIMMQLSVLNAAKKHIKLDQLVMSRVYKYDIEKYDYLLTPEPFQTITEFNKEDEKTFLEYGNLRGCLYLSYNREMRIGKLIEDKKGLKGLCLIKCITPEDYLKEKGFTMTHKIQTKWKDILTDKDVISSYALWKNTK